MTNMNQFLGLEHIFIFQQSSTITQKVQKHKRYVAVNCTVQSSNLAKNLLQNFREVSSGDCFLF